MYSPGHIMASQTPTRAGSGAADGGSPQLSVPSSGEPEEHESGPSTPARKKVVFSNENLRYNKKILKQARERNRASSDRGSGRAQSRSRSPQKQKQVALVEQGDAHEQFKNKLQPRGPSKSPAPVAFRTASYVGIRGGPTYARPEVGTGLHQHRQSPDNESHLSSTSATKKRNLEAPLEIFPAPKRRLLPHFLRSPSPSPHVSHRQYERIALENSEDELGQLDELGDPSPRPTRRLILPTSSLSWARKSPVHQSRSPQRQRPFTSTGSTAATDDGKQVARASHDSNGHENGELPLLVSNARHVTPPSRAGVPRQEKAVSAWRLASPPKVNIKQVPEPEVVRIDSDNTSDQSGNGDARSEDDFRIQGETQRRFKRAKEAKTEQEVRGNQPRTLEETAIPVPTLPNGEFRQRDTCKSVNDKAAKPSETSPITMCGERHYSQWRGTWDGETRRIPGAGALFPEGYEPRINESYPWICPIRDCQTVFPEAWALGGHFSASHRALLLNDNRDGTMSILGKRKLPDPGTGRMPALVISRQPLDPATAPPKAPPRQPGRRKKTEKRVPLSDVTPKRPKETPVSVPNPCNTPGRRSNSFLVVDLPARSNTSSRHFHLPDQHAKTPLHDKNTPTASSGLHSSKETRPTEAPNTRPSKGGFSGASGSDEAIFALPTRKSLKGKGGVPVSSRAARAQVSQECLTKAGVGGTAQGLRESITSTRKSGRLSKSMSLTRPTQQAPEGPAQAVSRPMHSAAKRSASTASKTSKSTPASVGARPQRSGRGALPLSSASSSSASSPSRGVVPPYTMSDWEIAPGRIRVGTGDKSENVAVSSTYLAHSSMSALPLTPTISFQLLTIQPGSSVHWRPSTAPGSVQEEEPRTRVCSVAQGIVKVKLCGQEFSLGPNGMFKVPAGGNCELGSVCYGGAVVHITCVNEGEEY
ncbi:Putative protein of unknown function [Podospora comata]|uniref:C2H2-type domain-containing protein n=1 Tax=Podospora comata TaxID=48703 RepID=A0ABY6S0Y7_PODCO|nr:Putative protein of unknown function [Podospora comata]